MKIAVTGAAGFIGSHVAEKLVQQGHEVVGIDCFTDYYETRLKRLNASTIAGKGVRFFEMDLLSSDLMKALEGVVVVYHFAAQPGISATVPFPMYVRNNLEATHAVLECCLNLPDFRCFVNASTSSVYGRRATESENAAPQPTSYYGVTKLAAEQLVMAYQRDRGLPAVSMRLYSVCGPRERPEKLFTKLIRCILEERPFTLFEGSEQHSRSFTYVGDIAEGLAGILDKLGAINGEIYNMGTTVEHTTGEGISMIEQLLGKPAQITTIPRRPGDQQRTCANIDKAQTQLGYRPKTALYDALKAQVEWYKREIHNKNILD